MKTLTPGHKYELTNFEPNRPSNDVSKGLRKDAYELCHAIEACGCSEQITKAVMLAAALGDKIGIIENGNQTIQFIEKTQDPNGPTGQLITVNNGTTNEEVLKMLIDRMQSLWDKFPSEETACSIDHLKTALYAQQSRTYERSQRGVEGKAMK